MAKHSRDEAYQLKDSDAHRKYYDAWSSSYDTDFAVRSGYIFPEELARLFLACADPEDDPILDIGCGTGLVGLAFAGSDRTVDGMDISTGMLAEAGRTGAYRNLIEVDLTKPSAIPATRYGGLVSCGAFTIGHLGPEAFESALHLGLPGALCAIGVNQLHYEKEQFGASIEALVDKGRISSFRIHVLPIYGIVENPDEPINLANVVVFRNSLD